MQNQQKRNNLLYFSSDESLNSDDSFNSSEEELFNQRNNFKNSVYYMKEQMNYFFSQNPDLKDELQLETTDYQQPGCNQQQQYQQQQLKNLREQSGKRGKPSDKSRKEFVNKVWQGISEDILKGVPKNKKLEPSLDTISHRLNQFRAKQQQVDYVELLAREIEDENILKKEKKEKQEKEKLLLEKEKLAQKEDQLLYYSFRKKMETQFRQDKEQEGKEKEKERNDRREGLDSSNDSMVNQEELKKVETILERLFDDQKIEDSSLDPKASEYQTQIGKIFFQVLQNNRQNKQQMRKIASMFVRDVYQRLKQQLNRSRQFPPQMFTFQEEHNRHLNILLPNFQATTKYDLKKDLFDNIDNIKVELASVESEFIKMTDKILEGKILDYWKEIQETI